MDLPYSTETDRMSESKARTLESSRQGGSNGLVCIVFASDGEILNVTTFIAIAFFLIAPRLKLPLA
mgnify:CR=1 FL=1